MDFATKYGPWALIAGASEGTGCEFARQIAAQGIHCVLVARREGPLADLAASPDVNVSYADPASDKYVSVSGAARVVEDPVKKQELWSVAAKAWFPGGVEDPDLALVAILVAEAEYWDVKANKAVQIFKLARAALTGEEPTDLAEHRRVRMR